MIDPGAEIVLTYPTNTDVGAATVMRVRELQVIGVRDLVADPLTPSEFMRRPRTRRSRWLIAAMDREARQLRRFYLGSSAEYETDGGLRVAVYRPGDRQPFDFVGREFGETIRERAELAKCLDQWCRRRMGRLTVRIVAADFRAVG